jgi:hypothetical protein
LRGRHAALSCYDCHKRASVSGHLPIDCRSCHAGDDVHDGRFGRDCAVCHGSETFKHPHLPGTAHQLPDPLSVKVGQP